MTGTTTLFRHTMIKNIILTITLLLLSAPGFAAKWKHLTGDELKTIYNNTVIKGSWKGTQYVNHECADGRSIQSFGGGEQKIRTRSFSDNGEMCVEDDKGKRCYKISQHQKKPEKLKFEGTNNEISGKNKLTKENPGWCA